MEFGSWIVLLSISAHGTLLSMRNSTSEGCNFQMLYSIHYGQALQGVAITEALLYSRYAKIESTI